MRATCLALGATGAMLLVTPALAMEIVFTPVADTVIYFGGEATTTASNALGDNLSVGQSTDGVTRRSLIRFDLSGVPRGTMVQSAQLVLYEPRSRANYDVSLHRLLTGWREGASNGGSAGASGTATSGDATWERAVFPNASWNNPGGDYVAAASATTFVGFPATSYVWSSAAMADDVLGWINAPEANHGWILIGEEATNQNAKLFSSRQSATAPVLTLQVTPVPEPGMFVLAAVGLGLVIQRLRSTRRRELLASPAPA